MALRTGTVRGTVNYIHISLAETPWIHDDGSPIRRPILNVIELNAELLKLHAPPGMNLFERGASSTFLGVFWLIGEREFRMQKSRR
jgi:hypothetical protein